MVWVSTDYGFDGLGALVAGIAITAALGVLMVSRFSYLSFKDIKILTNNFELRILHRSWG
jgi:hypothetical protein